VEIYVSTDIETDGPIPGSNSMLSFAKPRIESCGAFARAVFDPIARRTPLERSEALAFRALHGRPKRRNSRSGRTGWPPQPIWCDWRTICRRNSARKIRSCRRLSYRQDVDVGCIGVGADRHCGDESVMSVGVARSEFWASRNQNRFSGQWESQLPMKIRL